MPLTKICPSGCTKIASAELRMDPKLVATTPALPKLLSKVPSGPKRASTNSSIPPIALRVSPATRILPSACNASALGILTKSVNAANSLTPPLPKLGSRLPSAR